MRFSWLDFWIGFTSVLSWCSLAESSFSVEELCNEFIPENYEAYKVPSDDGKPQSVFIGFQILDIGEISEETMDFHLHLFILASWNDTRLELDQYTALGRPSIMYSECKEYIWTPDVFFETAKRIETFKKSSPTTNMHVFPDGSLVMSSRYSFTADCAMDFTHYPFDAQTCQFLLALMYSHDGIAKLKWIDAEGSPVPGSPIQIMRDIELLQFYLLDPKWRSFKRTKSNVTYTNLEVEFKMVRRLTGTFISTFLPSVLIVIMSWVSFWLRLDAIPARVALSITSLLTLCTQADQSKSHLPPISYMTALDIWLFMCIIMVFFTLLVSALSYNASKTKCEWCSSVKKVDKAIVKYPTGRGNYPPIQPWLLNKDKRTSFKRAAIRKSSNLDTDFSSQKNKICVLCQANEKLGQKIDDTSKVVFSLSFFVASLFYFGFYSYLNYRHF